MFSGVYSTHRLRVVLGSLSAPPRAMLVSPIFTASAVPFFPADFSPCAAGPRKHYPYCSTARSDKPPVVAKNRSQSARRPNSLKLGDTFCVSQAHVSSMYSAGRLHRVLYRWVSARSWYPVFLLFSLSLCLRLPSSRCCRPLNFPVL